MIHKHTLKRLLELEPKDQESYPETPGEYNPNYDPWGNYPILRWKPKNTENAGHFFLSHDPDNPVGQSLIVYGVDARIKALRALQKKCETYFEPDSQGFLYTYNIANHKQMVAGFEFCAWGYELLLNCGLGTFRFFMNTPIMRNNFKKVTGSDFIRGNIQTKLFENRLYEFLVPVLTTT